MRLDRPVEEEFSETPCLIRTFSDTIGGVVNTTKD